MAIEQAAATRLDSQDPCPDRILAGRVRSLLDLNVALVEIVNSRFESFNDEGAPREDLVADFRFVEAIRGEPRGPWTNIRFRSAIPSSTGARAVTANPLGPLNPKPGERFLFFSGANFDSCQVVPATPSAEAAVRNTTPAPRYIENAAPIGRRL
jgi:hypothetical protein